MQFDPSSLAKYGRLTMVARTVVEGFLNGVHKSPYKGFSVEFAEHRQYYPGDEIRHIDWRAYGKTDRYYIKEYEEETNLKAYLLVDASGSMAYRGQHPSKFQYAQYIAASLSYLMLHQRDAVGLLLFDTDIQDRIPARTRRGQLSFILHMLDRARPGKGTDFAGTLRKTMQFLRRRGIVVLISDFYEAPDVVMQAVRGLQFGGNDLILFHILDPGELEFRVDGPVQLEDLETAERLEVVPESMAQQYGRLLQDHIQTLQHECRSSRIDYTMLDTSRPLDHALFTFLSARQRAKR